MIIMYNTLYVNRGLILCKSKKQRAEIISNVALLFLCNCVFSFHEIFTKPSDGDRNFGNTYVHLMLILVYRNKIRVILPHCRPIDFSNNSLHLNSFRVRLSISMSIVLKKINITPQKTLGGLFV